MTIKIEESKALAHRTRELIEKTDRLRETKRVELRTGNTCSNDGSQFTPELKNEIF
jgi:hypothetical protein